jgi:hypothetical protein
MPRTSTETQRREAKRKELLERQAAADEKENQRKALEVEIGADFEVAQDDHAAALAAAAAAEVAMGEAIVKLFALHISPARIAALTGQPETEVKRLRKLAADSAAGPADTTSSTSQKATGTPDGSPTSARAVRSAEPAANGRGAPTGLAGEAVQVPGSAPVLTGAAASPDRG